MTYSFEEWPIDKPTKILARQITSPTRFIVTSRFDGPCLTITRSSRLANRFDGIVPPIIVECNFNSDGICLDLVDNVEADFIRVESALNYGIDMQSVRQAEFGAMTVSDCAGLEGMPSIIIQSDQVGKDASNGIEIDRLKLLNCGNEVGVYLTGNGEDIATCRGINIWNLFYQCPWPRAVQEVGRSNMLVDLPTIQKCLQPKARTVLKLDRFCQDINVLSGTVKVDDIASEKNVAVSFGEKVQDCFMSFRYRAPVGARQMVSHPKASGNTIKIQSRVGVK